MSAIRPIEDIEGALRGELSARAVGLAAGKPPLTRIVTATRRDRMRRRTYAGTGFVLVAALIAAASPAILGARHGAGAASAAASGLVPSQLLSMPPRGNLVRDTAFMQAAETRLPRDKVLYANDDGMHTVVIGAQTVRSAGTEFSTLIGDHKATASRLVAAAEDVGLNSGAQSYAFVGEFTNTDTPVPLVVLGPKSLSGIEYATGIRLVERQGELAPERTGVKRIHAVDGVATGEIADPASPNASSDFGLYFSVRARIDGEYVSATPAVRPLPTTLAGNIEDADYDPIRAAVVAKGNAAGLPLPLRGPDGDALADNVALVLSDLANLSGTTPDHVRVRVDWVGRETPEWDSSLVDFAAPGLPAIQAFVRGLAPEAPNSDSPSLAQSYVRPARPLIEGQFPTTSAAFGGTSEFSTIGGGLFEHW
jgi:hypothetical protein